MTGWRSSPRLARDHYIRLDSNDYSVHPAVIGRRIEVTAGLDRVQVFCDGRIVADHERVWAWHQTITDPVHLAAATALRQHRAVVCARPPNRRSSSGRWLTTTPLLGTDGGGGVMTAAKTAPGRDMTGRDRVPDPGAEGPHAARVGGPGWPSGPGPSPGPTRSSWSRACSGRSSARESHGGEGRIRAARFPARKRLEEFDFDQPAGSNARSSPTWAPWTSSPPGRTSCSSGRPEPARPTWPPASRSGPARPGTASRSPPPPNGSPASPTPTTPARLQAELIRLGRYPLLVIDEVGYIPFEPEAANLFFQLVSARYERASLIVTSNKPFGRWGEVFGDDVVAAAMIDRLVHHADVIALKGDSYRLKDRDLGRVPAAGTTDE